MTELVIHLSSPSLLPPSFCPSLLPPSFPPSLLPPSFLPLYFPPLSPLTGFVCDNGDIRLADGRYGSDGRLEICFDQRYGAICDNGFGSTEAAIACRQLGYNDGQGGEVSFVSGPNRILNVCVVLL